MAEVKGPTIASDKLALSRALGAAFLNHQVEQLEKTVSDAGPGSGNWRDRRTQNTADNHNNHNSGHRHPDGKRLRPGSAKASRKPDIESSNNNVDGNMNKRDTRETKDADVVVVDASVLIHALGQVKKWCREGREEIIIVPLEALNTLDLLKKGMSSLAQRARAASRILEAQVGTNPRIRVQRDDAFVLWDNVFENQAPPAGSPEWVRRTICCARWEVDHAADKEIAETIKNVSAENKPTAELDDTKKPHVVLAILSQTLEVQSEAIFPPLSHAPASPVPLPAPQTNRHEPRSSGALVAQWAAKARLEVLEVSPSAAGPSKSASPSRDVAVNGRRSPQTTRRSGDEEFGKRGPRRNSRNEGHRGGATTGGRPAAGTGLVERPPAVMAMMEAVAQPSRVVRVLARGEKLDPDT
ncbi:uncharacterized protein LAESUDRAFT_382234 [Laetiporus sulphureus 93-53]|uniref:PIN domain-containing protein n=1 Tax=Laetiporus sulphureus 93-53 TaxID=1314785 RepID=A0A165CM04_9APHY|nr:uncharacterized protein LAESUDRAFT_382234 [Laetiporus sulphureus 93-53]KZT03051.1 hypothetical protein LAESUDRAFT_382234 [Laetiporus sulphureus 93-53]